MFKVVEPKVVKKKHNVWLPGGPIIKEYILTVKPVVGDQKGTIRFEPIFEFAKAFAPTYEFNFSVFA